MAIDFSTFWNFSDPAASEQRFVALLGKLDADSQAGDRAEVLTQISRAQGLQRRFDDAHDTLARAQALIDETDSRPHIRLLLERGRVFNTSGQRDAASPCFEQAWEMARRIADDALAVDAAHMLGIVQPGELGMTWNRRALELAETSSDPGARRWKGSLLNNIAWSLHDSGRAAEALSVFEVALTERERAGALGPILIARWSVARCLRTLGRLSEALSIQQALSAEHGKAGTSDGFVQEEIGECLLALDRGAEARPHFRRAADVLSADLHLRTNQPERLTRLVRLAEQS